jgi:hypothetical protein
MIPISHYKWHPSDFANQEKNNFQKGISSYKSHYKQGCDMKNEEKKRPNWLTETVRERA